MAGNRPKKQCPYNDWVFCRDTTCDGCGWYPKKKPEQKQQEEKKE